jgi:competence protein ComEC
MRAHCFKQGLYIILATFVFLSFLSFGFFIGLQHIGKFEFNHISQQINKNPLTIKVRLVDELQEKKNSYQTQVEVLSGIDSSSMISLSGKILVYFSKDRATELQYGDELIIRAKIDTLLPPLNPNQFDYKRYLFHHDIYHRAFVRNGQWKKVKSSNFSIRKTAFHFRKTLLQQLHNLNFHGDEYAVASALLLGEKDYLSPELSRSYSSAGAMHVLAVSGLHVGIIFVIVNTLLKRLPNVFWSRILRAILLSTSVWIYALVTGLSPSVIRAATMFSAVALGGAFRQQTNIYNTLAGSAFVILLINPFMLMQVGMQLSYLAVLGIVYFQPKFAQLLSPKTWILKKVWEITCVSVAAQLATFPLGLLYFHQFPNYFLISNLVVIPAAFLMVYTGVITFSLCWIPSVQKLVGTLLLYITKGLNWSVDFLTSFPYAITTGIDLTTFQTWIIYAAIASFSLFLALKKGEWLTGFLTMCIGLMGYQIYERHQHLHHQELTIYAVKNATCIGIVNQLDAHLYASHGFEKDEDQLLFYLWHHLWHQDITKFSSLTPCYTSFDSTYSVIRINNVSILHLHQGVKLLPNGIPFDYLIASNEAFIPKEWLTNQSQINVLLDGTWRNSKAYYTSNWLESQHFLTVNLQLEGSVSRSLSQR